MIRGGDGVAWVCAAGGDVRIFTICHASSEFAPTFLDSKQSDSEVTLRCEWCVPGTVSQFDDFNGEYICVEPNWNFVGEVKVARWTLGYWER